MEIGSIGVFIKELSKNSDGPPSSTSPGYFSEPFFSSSNYLDSHPKQKEGEKGAGKASSKKGWIFPHYRLWSFPLFATGWLLPEKNNCQKKDFDIAKKNC